MAVCCAVTVAGILYNWPESHRLGHKEQLDIQCTVTSAEQNSFALKAAPLHLAKKSLLGKLLFKSLTLKSYVRLSNKFNSLYSEKIYFWHSFITAENYRLLSSSGTQFLRGHSRNGIFTHVCLTDLKKTHNKQVLFYRADLFNTVLKCTLQR